MGLLDAIVVLIVIFVLIGVAIYWGATQRVNRLVGSAPPGAQVGGNDDFPTAAAKLRNYHRVVEAVRIFNEIMHQDRQLAILDDETRKSVQAFLDNYYKDN